MYIEKNLVMLPTNKKANEDKLIYRENRLMFQTKKEAKNDRKWNITKYFHLYILSDEEIKEGDWYVNININKVLQCDSQNFGVINLFKHCKKIIATTDELLIKNMQDFNGAREINFDILVPKIPQSFIEHFVSEYNKGNIITKVSVKYEFSETKDKWIKISSNREIAIRSEILKINPDNTINIKPIKDSWSKKEQFEKIIKFRDDYEEFKKNCYFGPNKKEIDDWTNNWIEQNLK